MEVVRSCISVGCMGDDEVVDVSRKGCIACIAPFLVKDDDEEGCDNVLREVEAGAGAAFGVDAEADVPASVLERSRTFIEAAEPGIRFVSVGALRKSDFGDAVSASAETPAGGCEDIMKLNRGRGEGGVARGGGGEGRG